MSESIAHEIISRRTAVERIARRYGYSRERSEDIAQEAALRLASNSNLRSQYAKKAFIDVVRDSVERSYNRSGTFIPLVYESAFEDYADFINGFGSGDDLEGRAILRGELLDAISCLEILSPRCREIIELYAEGFTLVEISKRFGCSESRVSQLIAISRIKLKEAIVSKGLSRQEQRKRKRTESQSVSRKIQKQFRFQGEIAFAMESFQISPIAGLVSFTIPKIPKSLFQSF